MDASTDITVNGTVIDSSTGTTVAGATILVVGRPPVVSDASGHFVVTGVTAPYDVVVRPGGASFVRLYRGLTRTDPTVVARAVSETMNTATISGSATVSGTLVDDSLVCVGIGPRQLYTFGTAYSSGSSPIAWSSSVAGWYGTGGVDGTLHCVLTRSAGGAISNAFYGSRSISLAPGGAFTGQDVTLTAITTSSVSGTLVDPESSATLSRTIGVSFPGGRGFYFSGSIAVGAFTSTMPSVPGGQITVGARDTANGRATSVLVAPSATVVQDITMLARPSVTSPAPASSGVSPTAPITFTGGDGHVFIVTLTSGGNTIAEIVTSSKSVTLPDLTPFGLAYPAGANVVISVREQGMLGSTDAATNGAALFESEIGRTSYQTASSPSVSFMLAN
jgi:hypothetical protein